MYNLERYEKILKIIEERGSVSVSKLSSLLFVSPPTVRRDLAHLESEGRITRTHGGAVLRESAEREIPLSLREETNGAEKEIIALRALEYIKNGDVIFLDASSTVSHIIPHLKKFKDLLVVTNSPVASIRLGRENVKNYCTGGLLLPHSLAYVGREAEAFLSKINADICFFSSRGYTEGECITDSSIEEATVKQAMMKNAARSIYLCDNSKKNKKYIYNVCPTSEVERIITD